MKTLLEHAIAAFVFAGAIFVAGRDILRSMRRKGQYRRAYHGKFVLTWMLLGILTVMVVAAFTPDPTYAAGVMFGFGLLGVWAIGMVHGALMLVWTRVPVPPDDRE